MIRAVAVLSAVAAVVGIAAALVSVPFVSAGPLFGAVPSPTLIVAGALTFAVSVILDRDP